jgi:hypothetical protein
MYKVSVKKKVIKNIAKLPLWVQKKMAVLAMDLKDKSPEQPNWQNYSKLSSTEYHCHLGTSWVACLLTPKLLLRSVLINLCLIP